MPGGLQTASSSPSPFPRPPPPKLSESQPEASIAPNVDDRVGDRGDEDEGGHHPPEDERLVQAGHLHQLHDGEGTPGQAEEQVQDSAAFEEQERPSQAPLK